MVVTTPTTTTTPTNNFKSGKDVYFDRLKMATNKQGEAIKWDPNSIYARCARDGLCFRCKREDNDPLHRPAHPVFGLCRECDAEMSIGMEKVERMAEIERHRWFKD